MQCVNIEISGNDLSVDPATATDIGLLRKLADEYAPNNQSFIVASFWPGDYPLLGRKSLYGKSMPYFHEVKAFSSWKSNASRLLTPDLF